MWDVWFCYDKASCFAKYLLLQLWRRSSRKKYFPKIKFSKSFCREKFFQYFLFAFKQNERSYGIFFARKCQPKMLLAHHFEGFLDEHHLVNYIMDHYDFSNANRHSKNEVIDTIILDRCCPTCLSIPLSRKCL